MEGTAPLELDGGREEAGFVRDGRRKDGITVVVCVGETAYEIVCVGETAYEMVCVGETAYEMVCIGGTAL